jgi:FkbM family methyltransferase
MITRVKSLLPKSAIQYLRQLSERWFPANYAKESYSQEGEDMLLDRFLEQRHNGFYVDIGAHHPIRFSNTFHFYRKGWGGLNVDANPGSMEMFKRIRSRDINIEAAISSSRQELTYYIFNDPALNTFRKDLALLHAGGPYSIVKEVSIETMPLSELFDKYLPVHTKIDFLTVDVEGLDYEVLKSNDWSRYSPDFVLVECLGCTNVNSTTSDPIASLLLEHHYTMVAKTVNTAIFCLDVPNLVPEPMDARVAGFHAR